MINKMAEKPQSLTTEVQLPVDNTVVVDFLSDRYDRMDPGEVRGELENLYGTVWSEDQLQEQFDVKTIEPPYAHVVRKVDNVPGTIACVEKHKFYFLFRANEDAHERKEA